MRILFVTQVPLDRPFGAARHVTALARELARLGHRVVLVAPGEEGAAAGAVERVRPPRSLSPGARMEAANAWLALSEVRRARPDVAYVRISASTSLVPWTLFTLRVPVVLELNGRILAELAQHGRNPRAIAAARRALRSVVRHARALVAVDAKIARYAEEALGAPRLEVIENGADLDVATPGDRKEARERLGLPVGRIVAFAGTLAPELRLDLLFDALSRVPGLTLYVAGGGPGESVLERLVKEAGDRARWLGALPHERAVDLLRAADVCVNVRDGDLGMKCLEFAALGRRMVAFRMEGTERLESFYPGLEAVHLVGERTGAALAGALSSALDAEARLGALPPEAVARARMKLGWDRTAARLADLLDRVTAGGAPRRGSPRARGASRGSASGGARGGRSAG